ncbi:hypothetical protein D9M73_50310 [compost metagenome]
MSTVIRFPLLCVLLALAFPAGSNDLLNGVLQQAIGQAITQGVQKPGGVEQLFKSVTGQSSTGDEAGRAPGGAAGKFENGAAFHAEYIVQAWKTPISAGTLPGESGSAKGRINPKTAYGGKLSEPGAAAMRARLDRMYGLLLKQPPLVNVQGVSLMQGGSFGGKRGAATKTAVMASLMVYAFPINLENKATVRDADGSFYTPGEGDNLNIVVNDPHDLANPVVLGTYNGLTVLRRGGGYRLVVLNTDRPLLVNGELNKDLIDPLRPASDIQFMVIYVGAASSTWSSMSKGTLHPASGPGRMLGVMFNTDWPGLLKQVN